MYYKILLQQRAIEDIIYKKGGSECYIYDNCEDYVKIENGTESIISIKEILELINNATYVDASQEGRLVVEH